MQLRNFDISQVTAVKKRCILYAADGNKVIKRWRMLYPLERVTEQPEFSGLYLEFKKESYSECFRIYNDLGHDCVAYGYLSGWYGVAEEVVEHLKEYVPFIGLDGYKNRLAQIEKEKGWINNVMIQGLTDAGELELAEHYRAYHESQLQAREERTRIRHEELEEENRQRRLARQANLEKQVLEAERCIRMRQRLENAPSDGCTIVLYLMKKYGIKPPSGTCGWINSKLVYVTMQNDSVSYGFRRRKKGQGSKMVIDYLIQLRDKVDQACSAAQFI